MFCGADVPIPPESPAPAPAGVQQPVPEQFGPQPVPQAPVPTMPAPGVPGAPPAAQGGGQPAAHPAYHPPYDPQRAGRGRKALIIILCVIAVPVLIVIVVSGILALKVASGVAEVVEENAALPELVGPKWQRHHSAPGGYSAEFPGKVREFTTNVPSPDGTALMQRARVFSERVNFEVAFVDVDRSYFRDYAEVYNNVVDGMLGELDGTSLKSQQPLIIEGLSAREINFDLKNGAHIALQLVMKEGVLYMLIVEGHYGDRDADVRFGDDDTDADPNGDSDRPDGEPNLNRGHADTHGTRAADDQRNAGRQRLPPGGGN